MKTWAEVVAEHENTEGQFYYQKHWMIMNAAFALACNRVGDEHFYLDKVIIEVNKLRAARGLPPVDGKAER